MTRRSKVWLVVAVLFAFLNLGGSVVAALAGEVIHTAVHVGLMLLSAGVAWQLVPSRYRHVRRWKKSRFADSLDDLTERLTRLEQSVDAVAIEVERIGEGQRFITRVFTEKNASRVAGEESVGEPIENKAREEVPHVPRY